ncbi:MAG: hypothetical protein F4Z04_17315 [Acidobacteria bacterium]|nr:hypothetical protein [Acidobacteriota bacterium]
MRWRILWAFVLGAHLAGAVPVVAQSADDPDVEAIVQRIQTSVEHFYSRALHVMADVRVRVRSMARGFRDIGFPRSLLYEMRVEWAEGTDTVAPEPVVRRRLLEANGRPALPEDEPECADPEPFSEEPLAIFLPARRQDYVFNWSGRDRQAGRETDVIEYRLRNDEVPTIEWDDNCVSVDLPGQTRGRVWADAESGDVLRVDERLNGMFEFRVPREQRRRGGPPTMIIESSTSTVRYRRVAFSDPDETLLLPSSMESMTVWRNAGVTRQFITHEISNYRRFLTGARVIGAHSRP